MVLETLFPEHSTVCVSSYRARRCVCCTSRRECACGCAKARRARRTKGIPARDQMPLFLNGDFPNWHSVQRRPTTPEHQAYQFEQAKQYAIAVRNGGGVTGRPPTTLEALEALRAVQGTAIVLRESPSAAFLQRQREGLRGEASAGLLTDPELGDSKKHLPHLQKMERTDASGKAIRRSKRTSRLKERHQALVELERQVSMQLSRSKLERSSDSLLDDLTTKKLLHECAEETRSTRKLLRSTMPPPSPPPPPPPPPPAPAPSPKRTLRIPPRFDHNRFYNASTQASDGQRVVSRPLHQHEINAARERQRRTERSGAAGAGGLQGSLRSPPPALRQTAPPRRPLSASISASEMTVVPRPMSASSIKPKPPLSYSLSYGSLGIWAAMRHAHQDE